MKTSTTSLGLWIQRYFRPATASAENSRGPDRLLKQFTKTVLETALNEEMTKHLGYETQSDVTRLPNEPTQQAGQVAERLLWLLPEGTPEAGPILTLSVYRHLRDQLASERLPEPQQRGTNALGLLGVVRNRRVGTA